MIACWARLVIMDETWLYHYDLETEHQSMEWRHNGSPRPKNFRVKKSTGKVLASIFWGQDGILLIDYLPKGQTINAEYYSSLLVQLKDILKEKCCGKVTKGVLFLHDNALSHWALATQKKLAYLGFQYLSHPPSSPDRAPSDYHLFPGLKKQLKGRHFSSDAEVIAGMETWLDGQPSEYFLSGLQMVEQQAKKCIELHGEYVGYISSLVAVVCFLPGRAKDLTAPPRIYVSMFWRILLHLFSPHYSFYFEVQNFTNCCQTTWCHIQEGCELHIYVEFSI